MKKTITKRLILSLLSIVIVFCFTGCKKIIQKIDDPITPKEFENICDDMDKFEFNVSHQEAEAAGIESASAISKTHPDIGVLYFRCEQQVVADKYYGGVKDTLAQKIGYYEKYEVYEDDLLVAHNDTYKYVAFRDRNTFVFIQATGDSTIDDVKEIAKGFGIDTNE